MLSANAKKRLQHAVVAGIGISFLLLYLGGVSVASAPFAVAALAVTAAVCALAALAF